MTHTIEEIKQMLGEIDLWPGMEVGAGPKVISCYELLSELVAEVGRLRKLVDK